MIFNDLFLRRGWIPPLLLSLFVDHLRGTPLRALALLGALLWALHVFFHTRRRPAVSPVFLAFCAWAVAGLLPSVYRAGTLAELMLLAGAFFLWAGASVLWEVHPEERVVFSRTLVWLALLKAATAFLFPSPGGRLFLDPGDGGTANIALAAMFLSLALISAWPPAGRRGWTLWGVLAAATLWLCICWNATSALLGLAVGLPLEAAFRRKSRAWWIAAAGTLALLLVLFFSTATPAWLQYNPGNPARLERLTIWRDSLAYVRAHPWTGTGLGTYEQHYPEYKTLADLRTANYAHNEWLQVLCEMGLPGAVLVMLLMAAFFRRGRERGPSASAESAGLAALVLWACVYYPFRADPLLFAGAMMLAALTAGASVALTPRALQAFTAAALVCSVVIFSQGAGQAAERWGGYAWDEGDIPRALDRFRWASRFDPLEPRYLDHQVECLRGLGRQPETTPLLARAVALKPRDIWLRRKWAVARLHADGPAAARETYAPILTLAPRVPQFQREYGELNPPKAVE